uniref:Uncharacterized protein n=1 Tax=viral metagenome TaxID=1070528 RepID=A0A6M3LAR4_9ZZZZ
MLADTVRSGQTTVTTAGTAVRLSSATIRCTRVTIQALDGNTGAIYVGNDGAGDVTSANGFVLGATAGTNDRLTLDVADLAKVWIDSAVNGEGVSWIAEVV